MTILLEVVGLLTLDLLYHFSFEIWAFKISVAKQLPTNVHTYTYMYLFMHCTYLYIVQCSDIVCVCIVCIHMFACTHASFCAPGTPYNKTILFTHGYHLLLPFSLSPSLLPPPSILSPTSTFSYVPPPLPTSSSLLCPPYVPSSTFLFSL